MKLFTFRSLFCCRPEKSVGSARMRFNFILMAACVLAVFVLFARWETGSRSILKAAQEEVKGYRMTITSPDAMTINSVNEQHPQLENIPAEELELGELATVQQHKTTLRTRTTPMSYHFLLILVSSAPGNADKRMLIRETWGADSAIIPRWKTFFLLGQTTDQTQSDLLLKEGEAYGDLIRADFHDHYWNLTLKIQMGFEWAAKYCNFSFLLKADDDVLVIPWAVVSVLKEGSFPKNKLYMGQVYRHPHVLRYGTWAVTREEYPEETYPPFCPGFGYVLSTDVVRIFVELFGIVPFFRLDDVYVGVLAEKAGVKVLNNPGFQFGDQKCTLQEDTLVRHGNTKECLVELFRLASERRMTHS